MNLARAMDYATRQFNDAEACMADGEYLAANIHADRAMHHAELCGLGGIHKRAGFILEASQEFLDRGIESRHTAE